MCGRFALYSSIQEMMKLFGPETKVNHILPSYNIAPSQETPILIQGKETVKLGLMRWGFPMFWNRQQTKSLINIRQESERKKIFNRFFYHRRCAILANGFYEWDRLTKQPYYFSAKNKAIILFAGIYFFDKSLNQSGFAVLTKPAIDFFKEIHYRMPVLLNGENYLEWIRDRSYPSKIQDFDVFPVSKKVNNVKEDNEQLIQNVNALAT